MSSKHHWSFRLVAVAFLFVAMHTTASAQATRTWVSGVGDDANPCSRTAPCKTFAGAISKTAAGGEISVIDPGGFGGVTITKSITINNVGPEAGVLVSGTNAITISAAATDRVILRGLTIEGLGTGLNGVRFINGAALVIEDCQINGFQGSTPSYGVLFAPSSGASQLTIRNSTLTSNGRAVVSGGAGIGIAPTGSGSAVANIDNLILTQNSTGILADSSQTSSYVWVSVRNSEIAGSPYDGILAKSAATGNLKVTVKGNNIANNGFATATSSGVQADGAAATVRIIDNVIAQNKNGVRFANGGLLYSYGGNIISGNSINGSFSSTQATQ
jgi:hypothetical protein